MMFGKLALLALTATATAHHMVRGEFWTTSNVCASTPQITMESTEVYYNGQGFFFNTQCSSSGVPSVSACSTSSCSSCTPLDVLNNQCGHGFVIVPSAKVACIGGNYGSSGSSSSDLLASYFSSGAEVAQANTVLGAISLALVMAAMALF
ncbi:hypothetical protein SARC_06245 [Sphaeroforma arctica JP610]|uniref:Uncharacterized protein n=1 Tax=Sphaeroforma arctica JP610 TaxID=667725 RepID=A0A0L0FXQ3_9EUKA|nr:hypothetical protein SARC_06245 [Sphaeroforma arctica JP610]KNC81429.1 hypothetical protein SARC_06245 [Sphaeroforma arctica JP610]|eukprot:XP_014155331.1 hypothetical protein SARC_06245 [Sphaeroforma arctica JP610]